MMFIIFNSAQLPHIGVFQSLVIWLISSGVAKGVMGAVRPGRQFLGGGKIKVIP